MFPPPSTGRGLLYFDETRLWFRRCFVRDSTAPDNKRISSVYWRWNRYETRMKQFADAIRHRSLIRWS